MEQPASLSPDDVYATGARTMLGRTVVTAEERRRFKLAFFNVLKRYVANDETREQLKRDIETHEAA